MEAGSYGRSAGPVRRLTTETKHALKTTEFWVYVAFLIAVLIAGTVDEAEGTEFGAEDVWLFATIVTAAYLLSRGLAKSGSRDPYWDQPSSGGEDSLGERVKGAAQALAGQEQQGGGGTGQPGGRY